VEGRPSGPERRRRLLRGSRLPGVQRVPLPRRVVRAEAGRGRLRPEAGQRLSDAAARRERVRLAAADRILQRAAGGGVGAGVVAAGEPVAATDLAEVGQGTGSAVVRAGCCSVVSPSVTTSRTSRMRRSRASSIRLTLTGS